MKKLSKVLVVLFSLMILPFVNKSSQASAITKMVDDVTVQTCSGVVVDIVPISNLTNIYLIRDDATGTVYSYSGSVNVNIQDSVSFTLETSVSNSGGEQKTKIIIRDIIRK